MPDSDTAMTTVSSAHKCTHHVHAYMRKHTRFYTRGPNSYQLEGQAGRQQICRPDTGVYKITVLEPRAEEKGRVRISALSPWKTMPVVYELWLRALKNAGNWKGSEYKNGVMTIMKCSEGQSCLFSELHHRWFGLLAGHVGQKKVQILKKLKTGILTPIILKQTSIWEIKGFFSCAGESRRRIVVQLNGQVELQP